MNKEAIVALLPLLNSKARLDLSRPGWVTGACVFAKWKHGDGVDAHPSFGIKIGENKKSIAKCLSCGWGGDLEDLLMELSILMRKEKDPRYNMGAALQLIATGEAGPEYPTDIPDYGVKYDEHETYPYPDVWLKTFRPAGEFSEAVKYLHKRGYGAPEIGRHDLRFDAQRRRLGFPFRDFKGALMGLQGRAIDEDAELRYYFYDYGGHKNMHTWLGEHQVDLDKPVVLVEGPFDYVSVKRVYNNVMASFTTGLGMRRIHRLADCMELITFYDYGKGGDAAREMLSGKGPHNTRSAIRKVLKGKPITHIIPSEEHDDPGAMTVYQVAEYLKEHVKLV